MREWFDKNFGSVERGISTVRDDLYNRLIVEGYFGRSVPEARSSDPLGRTLPEQPERHAAHDPTADRSPETSRDQNRGVDLDR
ncbi:hypothetical protein [Novosphingobium sp.]|uniref:hypothetical protein n=1 Tax=Novosphingobium sp. TaxID=1874826 RepID=UPI0038BB0AC7